jgi:hypothetical protein
MAKGLKRRGAGALGSVAPTASPGQSDIAALVAAMPDLDLAGLSLCWRNHLGGTVPAHLPRWLLIRVLGYRIQAATHGDLDRATLLKLKRESGGAAEGPTVSPFAVRAPATREGADLRPGALLAREWRGKLERVTALEQGFAWNGKTYGSLSQVAKAITGTNWNGHRFFGLRSAALAIGRTATSKSRERQASRVCCGPVPEAPR